MYIMWQYFEKNGKKGGVPMHLAVVVYFLINLVLGIRLYLRNKWKALIWHSLVFTAILFVLAIGLSEGSFYEPLARKMLSVKAYSSVCTVTTQYGIFIFGPLMAAEWIIPFMALTAIGTAVALILLFSRHKDEESVHPEADEKQTGSLSDYTYKLYRKNCVMRC